MSRIFLSSLILMMLAVSVVLQGCTAQQTAQKSSTQSEDVTAVEPAAGASSNPLPQTTDEARHATY